MIPSRTAAALAAGFGTLLLTAPDALARKPAQPTAQPQKTFERMVFTADEGAAARIGGIPEARFFADSLAEYDAALASAKVSGEPWLVLSGAARTGRSVPASSTAGPPPGRGRTSRSSPASRPAP